MRSPAFACICTKKRHLDFVENAQSFYRAQMLDNPLKSMVFCDAVNDSISDLQKSDLVGSEKS